MLRRFLAIEPIPLGATPEEVARRFERLAQRAREHGARTVETFYAPGEGEAFTLFEAADVETIRRVHLLADVAAQRIAPAERMYPDLLRE